MTEMTQSSLLFPITKIYVHIHSSIVNQNQSGLNYLQLPNRRKNKIKGIQDPKNDSFRIKAAFLFFF